MTDLTAIDLGPVPTNTVLSQYACANYPYTLTYTVFAEDVYLGVECAPPWVTNPASLAAWSTTAASQVSNAMIQDFADPFDQVVVSAYFSASTVLPPVVTSASSSLPAVNIPTTAPAISSTTTSAGTKRTVSWRISLYTSLLLAAVNFLLSYSI